MLPGPGGAIVRDAPCPLPDPPLVDAPLPDAPLPDARDERESPALVRRGLSSAQLKPSEAPLPDAPGEPESLATIRCGISSAQPNVSEASVRTRTLTRKPGQDVPLGRPQLVVVLGTDADGGREVSEGRETVGVVG